MISDNCIKKKTIVSQVLQNRNAEIKMIASGGDIGWKYVLVYLNDTSKLPIFGDPGEEMLDLLLRVKWLGKDSEGKYYIIEE